MRSSMLKHRDAEEQDIFRYIPTAETPGFKRASPRAFQVLVVLLGHAIRFPTRLVPAYPNDLDAPSFGLEAIWTVDELAHICGCGRNTVGTTLTELAALGWIQKRGERDASGKYRGFWYRLLAPPSTEGETTTESEVASGSQIDELGCVGCDAQIGAHQ
jgi:hypothetical protein